MKILSLLKNILDKKKGKRSRIRRTPGKRVLRKKKGLEEYYPLAIIALVTLAALWVFFAPGAGISELWKKYRSLHEKEQVAANITKENEKLRAEIHALEDDTVLEQEARDRKLSRKGEFIYVFPEKQKSR